MTEKQEAVICIPADVEKQDVADLRAFARQKRLTRVWRSLFWISLLVFVGNLATPFVTTGMRACFERFHRWKSARANAPRKLAMLERAKATIPRELKQIYTALNEGNPRELADVVDSTLLGDYHRLDNICKPFTYRAHYVESIIERPGDIFEVRARGLFRPQEERATLFAFRYFGGQFVLINASHDSSSQEFRDWFQPAQENAIELSRKFIFGIREHREDVVQKLLDRSIVASNYTSDSCCREFFASLSNPDTPRAELVSYKGLKTEVKIEFQREGILANVRGVFLIEQFGQTDQIVSVRFDRHWWGKRLDLDEKCANAERLLTSTEDPQMEARTLARYGLAATNEQASVKDK